MLLKGIYYGKTPIAIAYKGGEVIWRMAIDHPFNLGYFDIRINTAAYITADAMKYIDAEDIICIKCDINANTGATKDAVAIADVYILSTTSDIAISDSKYVSETTYNINLINDNIANVDPSHLASSEYNIIKIEEDSEAASPPIHTLSFTDAIWQDDDSVVNTSMSVYGAVEQDANIYFDVLENTSDSNAVRIESEVVADDDVGIQVDRSRASKLHVDLKAVDVSVMQSNKSAASVVDTECKVETEITVNSQLSKNGCIDNINELSIYVTEDSVLSRGVIAKNGVNTLDEANASIDNSDNIYVNNFKTEYCADGLLSIEKADEASGDIDIYIDSVGDISTDAADNIVLNKIYIASNGDADVAHSVSNIQLIDNLNMFTPRHTFVVNVNTNTNEIDSVLTSLSDNSKLGSDDSVIKYIDDIYMISMSSSDLKDDDVYAVRTEQLLESMSGLTLCSGETLKLIVEQITKTSSVAKANNSSPTKLLISHLMQSDIDGAFILSDINMPTVALTMQSSGTDNITILVPQRIVFDALISSKDAVSVYIKDSFILYANGHVESNNDTNLLMYISKAACIDSIIKYMPNIRLSSESVDYLQPRYDINIKTNYSIVSCNNINNAAIVNDAIRTKGRVTLSFEIAAWEYPVKRDTDLLITQVYDYDYGTHGVIKLY